MAGDSVWLESSMLVEQVADVFDTGWLMLFLDVIFTRV